MDYAYHYHFFGKDSAKQKKEDILSDWLIEASDFESVPGKGVQCCINGRTVLVSK